MGAPLCKGAGVLDLLHRLAPDLPFEAGAGGGKALATVKGLGPQVALQHPQVDRGVALAGQFVQRCAQQRDTQPPALVGGL